jgi:large subunit ribosomal protein L22
MKAHAHTVRVSTRKVRLVADSIRNMPIVKAIDSLALVQKHGAASLLKAIKSAVANAVNNNNSSVDKLFIDRLEVNEGPFLKRFKPSTRGRVHPLKKRTAHITVILKERGDLK